MESARSDRLIASAAIVVLCGMAVQFVIAPDERAWGFYEVAGCTVAALLLMYAGARKLYRWWTRPIAD